MSRSSRKNIFKRVQNEQYTLSSEILVFREKLTHREREREREREKEKKTQLLPGRKSEIYVHNTPGPLIFPYRIPKTMYTRCSIPAIDMT